MNLLNGIKAMNIINLITKEPIKMGEMFCHTKIEKDNGKVSTTTIKCIVDPETIPYLTELGYIEVQEDNEEKEVTPGFLLDIFTSTINDMAKEFKIPSTKLIEIMDSIDNTINPQIHLNVIVGIMAKALNKGKKCGNTMYCISSVDHGVFELPAALKDKIAGFYRKEDAEAVAKSINLLDKDDE